MPKYSYQFQSPAYIEEGIIDDTGRKIGTIRVKPVSVGWKPPNAREFLTVDIDQFAAWITSPQSGARRTKS